MACITPCIQSRSCIGLTLSCMQLSRDLSGAAPHAMSMLRGPSRGGHMLARSATWLGSGAACHHDQPGATGIVEGQPSPPVQHEAAEKLVSARGGLPDCARSFDFPMAPAGPRRAARQPAVVDLRSAQHPAQRRIQILGVDHEEGNLASGPLCEECRRRYRTPWLDWRFPQATPSTGQRLGRSAPASAPEAAQRPAP